MEIAVTGAEGLIGNQVAKVFSSVRGIGVYKFNHSELDITDETSINSALRDKGVNVLVNCAGNTNAVIAQSNPDFSEQVNFQGATNLAKYCRTRGIKMVQISPAIVFNEPNIEGYIESNKDPFKLNQSAVLARHKAMAECEILNLLPDSEGIVVRSSKVFGSRGGDNYVKRLLVDSGTNGLVRIADDEFGNPTFSKYLAWSLFHLISKWEDKITKSGNRVFHAVPNEVASDYKQATFAGVLMGISSRIVPGKRDYRLTTNPAAVLKNSRLFRISGWEEGIRELMYTVK